MPYPLKGRLAPVSSNSPADVTFTGNEGRAVETQEVDKILNFLQMISFSSVNFKGSAT